MTSHSTVVRIAGGVTLTHLFCAVVRGQAEREHLGGVYICFIIIKAVNV